MSNGEMFIVAKPHFETTASGQSEISIVDVWIVPDNGQGRVPTNIDELRAGDAPRFNTTQDSQRFYQPLAVQNNFQHMTLYRTPRGWEIQHDVDPRLERFRVPRISQDQVDPRYAQNEFRSNCACSHRDQPSQFYVEPRSQFRVQRDPRRQSRVEVNPQNRTRDQRYLQVDYQRQYQDELRRMPNQELQERYEILMRRRQEEQQNLRTQKIDPRLPEAQYKKQYQLEVQRREQVELQRKADAELQRTYEVEMRRRVNEQQQKTQLPNQGSCDQRDDAPRTNDEEQRRQYEIESRRRYEMEMQRRLNESQRRTAPQPQPENNSAPQPWQRPPQAAAPRPQGRAAYGVDPGMGLLLERRNQEMRREVDLLEGGEWNPGRPAAPQGRARYGVDPRTARELARRDVQDRQDAIDLDDAIFNRPQSQQYRPQYQGQAPYVPQAQVDPERWNPRGGNLRTWKDGLDFDPERKLGQNVGNYLNRYGPTNQPARDPNGVYGPSPFSPQGIIEGSVDSTLRSWGNYLRGK
ncbi:MAG: hypothetical protein SGJ27_05030 [Candidatus Melainabacteria bacterium]|nr:hypothetical protein [Candidatus Melainabacteria bacterium]